MSEQLSENINQVIEEMEQKCTEHPDSLMAHHHLALVYRKAGRQNDAIAELKKCLEIDEQSYEAYINLGAIYFEMGNLDEARSLCRNLDTFFHQT